MMVQVEMTGEAPIFRIFLNGEEEEHHTDVCPEMHILVVDNGSCVGHIGTHEESGNNVTQHQRLFKFLENQGHDTCHYQHQRQVLNH